MQTSLTIAAPTAGTLLGWALSPVRMVAAGDELGAVKDAAGTTHAIVAPAAGEFRASRDRGAVVAAGDELAILWPSRPADAPRAPLRVETVHAPSSAPRPAAPATARHSAPQRPAPIVEELTMPRAKKEKPAPEPGKFALRDAPATRPEPVETPRETVERHAATAADAPALPELPRVKGDTVERRRTRHATYHLTGGQQEAIKELALSLKLVGGDELGSVGESEIVRAAIELFMSMPGAAKWAVLKDNRQREIEGKYGSGWPRPGRAARRKK